MKQREALGWLVLIWALSRRRSASSTSSPAPWTPYGPFPEGNTIPPQPQIPANPLEQQ